MTTTRTQQSPSERGVVGGVEVLPFGMLVFVTGTLILANLWAVVDAKLAVETAAREAGRAYAEAPDQATASSEAGRAAREAMAGAGRNPDRLVLARSTSAFVRCAVVEHRASYRIPSVTVPFLGGLGHGATVVGRHRDVLDPFRAGLGGPGACNG